ncbi:MAG TPA: hypothetical protein VI389_09340, partial [Geobacteraceae bacterium]
GLSSPVGANAAVVTLSVQGTATTVGGVQTTVDLPAGVTVAADASNNYAVSNGVLTPLGATASGSLVAAQFVPATATTPAKVRIGLINVPGFAPGEFLSIKCDIAPGSTPQASGFSVEPGASVSDSAGHPVSGASVTLSVRL